ncbi:MAG: LysM peptidoglycan-binding domain-containing protein, partial [Cyanobacteria bacterium KgW148]|nr:LysM peptidoglycan-binding domain-containing protein [Cyanobacteria bacterium KgW148]
MNKFSFPAQVPAVHHSIALLGLAISVGTTGTLIYEPKDDLQAQTVPTKLNPIGSDRPQLLWHQVQPGDSLWLLSKTYNLDAAVIAAANNISALTPLPVGEKLLIPPTEGVLHHTKPGETIEQIAEFYDVRVEEIAKFSPEVEPGKPIVVPGNITTLLNIRAEDAKNRLAEEKERLEKQLASLEQTGTYKVQPGDTIEDLAIEFKTSKAEIIAANQLQDPDFLAVGQELEIPGMLPVSTSKVDLPKFIPTISQEIAQGNKGSLIELAAQFGILPAGGENPIPEQKIAALPVKEEPLPIVTEIK